MAECVIKEISGFFSTTNAPLAEQLNNKNDKLIKLTNKNFLFQKLSMFSSCKNIYLIC
jgi:hypothetical protein